jgi:signal transduction histidine kinase
VLARLREHPGEDEDERMRRIAPWAVASITVAGLVAAAILDSLASPYGAHLPLVVAWVVATGASTTVGLVLATRCRGNPIGWLLLANGLVVAAMGTAGSYADYTLLREPGALPGGAWALLFSERGWPLLLVGMTAIAWIFPDGRLPSPRWRPYAFAGAASVAVTILLTFVRDEAYSEKYADFSSPLPTYSGPAIGAVSLIAGLGAAATLVVGVLAVWTRLGRSSGIERLQLKWLAYAAALIPASIAACFVEIAVTGDDGPVTTGALILVLTSVPAAIGIALLRYRLFEIDRLINRTLVYAGLSAALAATFALVTLALGVVIGSGSTLTTAAATLTVALLFGPLRSRAQRLVDRRFDRARYEGLRIVERYLDDLREGRATPEATRDVLARALGDPGLELLFQLPDERVEVDLSGRPVEGHDRDGRARTPVRRGSFPLATVLHDETLGERPDLLESVIGAAGFAIEIARLRVEVRRQLAEVQDSRLRIVTAGDEERRRLERDLHDGAQQRLVSIGLTLRHLEAQLPAGSPQAQTLDATVSELARAIDELRELARGVRPAGLDDGLAPALRQLTARSRLRVSVRATEERFADRLETAAYFVASEALANAAKHANASRVDVVAERQNGSLVVSIRDDGVGGAKPSDGSGLSGIADRVAALGGSVTVASPAGHGTVVTAELPCGS